jgi:cytidylate kinase
VAAHPAVRDFLLEMQRAFAREHSVVMDGRDIGTVVLPQAACKIFLTASAEVRAQRRCRELEERGTPEPYETVLEDMRRRDELDCTRAVAPLRQAEDAVLLDTSTLTFEESEAALLRLIERKLGYEA